ncbi:MAG: hypothetical protein AMJ37_02810 [Dehalococcoidia bacterium DG_18]|nr:MAG: hypothetical protein AMJ37_02810 [Dehalococcoidia bacterium DG_18]
MDANKIDEVLTTYLRPQSMPLAIRMCRSAEELPERVRIPARDLGFKIAVCQGISMARRYGWTLAIGKEDLTCPIPGITMGFLPPKEGYLDGSFMESQGFGSREAHARTAQALPKLEYGKYRYLLMGPIGRAAFEPQAVLVYGNPAQVVLLIAARLFGEGDALNFTASGGASCIGCTVAPIVSDECQVILPGAGERINAMVTPDEIAFAMPMSKVEPVLNGLEAGYKTGIMRYPTPTWLRFQPQHPPYLVQLLEYLTEAE